MFCQTSLVHSLWHTTYITIEKFTSIAFNVSLSTWMMHCMVVLKLARLCMFIIQLLTFVCSYRMQTVCTTSLHSQCFLCFPKKQVPLRHASIFLFFCFFLSFLCSCFCTSAPSQFGAEFRRFSLDRWKPGRFDEFYGLLQHVHRIPNVELLVGYADVHGDLLPINNDDNYHKAISTASPLLRLFLQRKGKHRGIPVFISVVSKCFLPRPYVSLEQSCLGIWNRSPIWKVFYYAWAPV